MLQIHLQCLNFSPVWPRQVTLAFINYLIHKGALWFNPTLPGRFWYLHSLGGGGGKVPPSIFSFFFKLCQPNLVRGNNVQK